MACLQPVNKRNLHIVFFYSELVSYMKIVIHPKDKLLLAPFNKNQLITSYLDCGVSLFYILEEN